MCIYAIGCIVNPIMIDCVLINISEMFNNRVERSLPFGLKMEFQYESCIVM